MTKRIELSHFDIASVFSIKNHLHTEKSRKSIVKKKQNPQTREAIIKNT